MRCLPEEGGLLPTAVDSLNAALIKEKVPSPKETATQPGLNGRARIPISGESKEKSHNMVAGEEGVSSEVPTSLSRHPNKRPDFQRCPTPHNSVAVMGLCGRLAPLEIRSLIYVLR